MTSLAVAVPAVHKAIRAAAAKDADARALRTAVAALDDALWACEGEHLIDRTRASVSLAEQVARSLADAAAILGEAAPAWRAEPGMPITAFLDAVYDAQDALFDTLIPSRSRLAKDAPADAPAGLRLRPPIAPSDLHDEVIAAGLPRHSLLRGQLVLVPYHGFGVQIATVVSDRRKIGGQLSVYHWSAQGGRWSHLPHPVGQCLVLDGSIEVGRMGPKVPPPQDVLDAKHRRDLTDRRRRVRG